MNLNEVVCFVFSFPTKEYYGYNVYILSIFQLFPTMHHILAISLPKPIDYSFLPITCSSFINEHTYVYTPSAGKTWLLIIG